MLTRINTKIYTKIIVTMTTNLMSLLITIKKMLICPKAMMTSIKKMVQMGILT